MAITFGPDVFAMDDEAEVARISEMIRSYLVRHKRKGAVVAVSGGIDSSVVAALCVRALGPERVLGLHMPETESADETLSFSRSLTDALGVDSVLEDISPILAAAGCYRRRDDAIRRVVPGLRARLQVQDRAPERGRLRLAAALLGGGAIAGR